MLLTPRRTKKNTSAVVARDVVIYEEKKVNQILDEFLYAHSGRSIVGYRPNF